MQIRLLQYAYAKPFLKWAGGKGQILGDLESRLPEEAYSGEIKKYAEPFIGGGALFFYIVVNFPDIEDFYISDRNQDLILAYRTIRDYSYNLITYLKNLENLYFPQDSEKRKVFYYKVRESYNKERINFDYDNYGKHWLERTSKLIFLNRTCFNGLYRVNSKGDFNVPVGRYKNPRICDSENIENVSKVLQKVEIVHADFSKCIRFVDSNTLVYFDPPYRPLNETSSFTSYSKDNFDDSEQKRLARFFKQLDEKGAKLILSNSDPQNIDKGDIFFEKNYQGFHIKKINALRMINSKVENRGKIKELIITNYFPHKTK